MKPWYFSKTLWINAIIAGLIALEAVSGTLQPHLPVNVYMVFSVALPIINAVLRVITTQQIK